jgi:hypothetical protein
MAKSAYNPTEHEGVHAIGLVFTRDFCWAFREQPKADLGIDAHVEVCKGGEPTGNLLALQIKSGESYCKEQTERGFVYRGSRRHLQYWTNHPLPVALVIYSPAREKAYWQGISRDTVETTKKGWKTVVPFQHLLDKSALPHVLEFVETRSIKIEPSVESFPLVSSLPVLRTLETGDIAKLRDEFIARTSEVVAQLTEQLWHNEITVQQWHSSMQDEIKTAFICEYLLAKGGRNLMAESDYARIGTMLGQQYKSLEVFVSDIVQGRYDEADMGAVIERSKLHVTCSRLAFEMARTSRGDSDPVYVKTVSGWKVRS